MGKETPEGTYVGTTNCPQAMGATWTDANGVAHVWCGQKANVYKHPKEKDFYQSHCPLGHSHGFGEYYLENVDQAAEQLQFVVE